MAWRYWLGLVGVLIVALVLGPYVYTAIAIKDPHMTGALLWGLIAAGATAIGSVPALFARGISDRVNNSLMGFGAGVMLAATSFSLILPGLETAYAQGFGPWSGGAIVSVGILVGAVGLLALHVYLPHERFNHNAEDSESLRVQRAWLFVTAIILHNLPEGLAIGVAFAGTDLVGARALAFGIAIQDIPEGLVIALALMTAGYGRWLAFTVAVLSGVVEPIMAVAGVALISMSAALLPWGLAVAAGAMLFVISHEIIPESHRKGHQTWATTGLMLGFVLMMLLDTALG